MNDTTHNPAPDAAPVAIATTGFLSKDQILSAPDNFEVQEVDVPEWGGKVRIKSMSAFARDQFEAGLMGKNGGTNYTNLRAKLVAAVVIDDNDELMFTEQDVAKLGKKAAAPVQRIFNAAQKMNGFSDADVDELAKNS